MNTFVYPNGYTLKVTDETCIFNNYTWSEENKHKVYESDSIKFVYDKLSDCVDFHGNAKLLDIGAQSGLFSLYSKYFENVTVDAYEPLEGSYNCLVENIKLNNIQDRVFPFQIAISNTKSKTIMKCPSDHTGLNTLGSTPLRFNKWDDIEVSTDTIDNLYANRRVDFIKSDVEGWEYFVLQGGQNVLRRDKPELLLEVHEENMKQCGVTIEKFFEQIHSLGYIHKGIIDRENFIFSAK